MAELAGLEFGARVRRAHVEGQLARAGECACPGTCNLADVFMKNEIFHRSLAGSLGFFCYIVLNCEHIRSARVLCVVKLWYGYELLYGY